MANEGFIKVYRKMQQWGWYDEPNTKAVFLHLLFLAQYEETFYRGVHLDVGQAVATLQEIAIANGITVKQVRVALAHLEGNEVAITRHPKFCVYTIKNYDMYNGEGTQRADKGHAKGNQRARKGQSLYILRSQEVKEIKKCVGNADANDAHEAPKTKVFEKPTKEQLEAYSAEIGYRLDAQRFLDYYDANGWMVGKTRMKDWKACVRNWKRRDDAPPVKRVGRNTPVSRELPADGNDFLKDAVNRPRKLKRGD